MNNETLTKSICYKGFSEYAKVIARSNLCVSGQVTDPQSLIAYKLNC